MRLLYPDLWENSSIMKLSLCHIYIYTKEAHTVMALAKLTIKFYWYFSLKVKYKRCGASLPRLFPSHITEDMLRSTFWPASEIRRLDSEEFLFVVPVLNPRRFQSSGGTSYFLPIRRIQCWSNQIVSSFMYGKKPVLLPPWISSSIFCVMRSLVLSSVFVRSSHADNR